MDIGGTADGGEIRAMGDRTTVQQPYATLSVFHLRSIGHPPHCLECDLIVGALQYPA